MNAAPLSPEQLRAHIAALPGGSPPFVDDLRRQSTRPAGVVADPLAPDGLAAEQARQDHQRALRQQLKVLLAGSKLHAGLVTAALGQPTDPGDAPSDADDAGTAIHVARYVERATRWIEATTDELARRWGSPDDPPPADPSEGAVALSGYHRYELAWTLVATLRQRPEWLEQIEPEHMAAYLAAPPANLPAEPAASPWVSAGSEADLRLAWSRTLARVLETAAETPFNRPLDEVLGDARLAIASAVDRQRQILGDPLELTPEARQIVELHTLKIAGQLYAATLSHVYHESTRMIQRYQELLQQGQEDEADRLAQSYQERRLGYAGVPHYFQQIAATHEHQQEAALAAMTVSSAPSNPPTNKTDTGRATAPGSVASTVPATPAGRVPGPGVG